MKKVKVTKYICSYCGKEFMDEDKCVACEEFHDKVKRVLPYEDGDYDISTRKGSLAQPKVVTVELSSGMKAVYRFDHVIAASESEEEDPKEEIASDAEADQATEDNEKENFESDDPFHHDGGWFAG